jgi:hypothetical protein
MQLVVYSFGIKSVVVVEPCQFGVLKANDMLVTLEVGRCSLTICLIGMVVKGGGAVFNTETLLIAMNAS